MRPAIEYHRAYRAALPSRVWVSRRLRNDQRIVLAQIEACAAAGDVLDIGCFDGALLAALPPQYRRFGIEPASSAAEIATGLGVQVLGNSTDVLSDDGNRFDIICAVDTIEHLEQPRALLSFAARQLRPGGYLLISTGDFDCRAWTDWGSRYWYCAPPEHIRFVSEEWARRAAPTCGLELHKVERFRHGMPLTTATDWLKQFAKWLIFRSQVVRSGSRKSMPCVNDGTGAGHSAEPVIGFAGLAADHILLAFRRPLAGSTA